MIELPFEQIVVPGDRAAEVRRDYRDRDGIVPVILGAPHDIDALIDNLAFLREDPKETITRGATVDVAAWYEERYAGDPTTYSIDEGEWPENVVPNHDLVAVRTDDGEGFLPEVVIGLLRVAQPWEVPAHLGFGGWNDCPQPHEHVALFKRWHERFGASVASVVGSLIELEVARPPLDQDAADLLAMEHFLYCPDLVPPDEGSLADLASTLMFGSIWTFIWK